MAFNPSASAAFIASRINHPTRGGDTITLADGSTIKAIVDTNYETVKAAIPETLSTIRQGDAPALFYVTEEGHAKIQQNAGEPLKRKGIAWSIQAPVNDVSFADTTLVKVLLCTSGGNPD